MGKNGFVIYHEYAEHFKKLTNEELGILFRAIMDYETDGTIPELDGAIGMAFSFIRFDLDKNKEKYEKRCEKNQLNGQKGGRPAKTERLTEKPKETERFLEKPKKPDSDSDSDSDSERDKDIKHIAHSQANRAIVKADSFSEFWSLYPRKTAKKVAQKSYNKLIRQGVNPDVILQGVTSLRAWIERNGKEIQYIPHPATWLNQERWQDVLVDDMPAKPPWEKERQRRETESDMAAERVKSMLAGGEIDLLGGG